MVGFIVDWRRVDREVGRGGGDGMILLLLVGYYCGTVEDSWSDR